MPPAVKVQQKYRLYHCWYTFSLLFAETNYFETNQADVEISFNGEIYCIFWRLASIFQAKNGITTLFSRSKF